MSPREGVGDDLLRRVEDGVLWITLNRPEAGNAMTTPMRDQIGDWMIEASADPWVRAVVLTGAGEKGFCTGADIRSQRRDPPPKPEGAPERIVGDAARVIRTGWGRLVTSIMDCEKPVIAGVNGTAAGGGMHLALACDLVVMAEEAKLISVFVRRGIAPDAGGAYILTRLVGLQKAKELFFFGDDIPAAEAHRIGLANKVVPRADLEKTLAEWAGRLASGPTKAIAFAKWLANRAVDVDRNTAMWDEGYAQELVSSTEDSKEGMMSFVERRPAEFKGW
ncbi:MAG TPA: enoyl-CoA hydratase-related protein [Acidimicrobiales bacterium]|nr:enoyl-CoA hydratase-related protein [Acidimicrobiales bacterium]